MGQKEPKNGKTEPRLLQFRRNAPASEQYYYSDCDKDLIVQAIDAVTRQGAAIMFGMTRDGGAFSLLVLDANEKAKEYPHGPDELRDVLRAITATYTE